LQTVFQTLIESAARLCGADRAGISRVRGATFQHVAVYGFDEGFAEYMQAHPLKLNRSSINGRTALERSIVHIHDVLSDPEYTPYDVQKLGSFRTALGVPLLREGIPIGTMFLGRTKVEPFSQQEIDLVSTFADQAVIAIENVRLFEAEQQRSRELAESLEQQTTTSEVLRVISSSPGELEPVFNALLANAIRICEATFGNLFLFEGNSLRTIAVQG
jgi:two-component system, NtrC family, sensor kinase